MKQALKNTLQDVRYALLQLRNSDDQPTSSPVAVFSFRSWQSEFGADPTPAYATAALILRDTARMSGVGLVLGSFLAIAATRLETSVLFGVRPLDALSMTGAIGVLAFAIVLAAWLPARRAASIDPIKALRTE